MSKERIHESVEQSPEKTREIEELGAERAAEIEQSLEARTESSQEKNPEKLQEEAEKIAEKQKKKAEKQASPAEKRKDAPLPNTKAGKKAAFNKTMKDVRSQLPPAERAFSKIIHLQPVEKSSEFVGATLARPNALLAGSVSAFVLTLAIYLVARHYGYPLTGTESIAAFIIGWIAGILFDYLRVMITGKRST